MKINFPIPFVEAIISAEIASTNENPSAIRIRLDIGSALRMKMRGHIRVRRFLAPRRSNQSFGVVTTP